MWKDIGTFVVVEEDHEGWHCLRTSNFEKGILEMYQFWTLLILQHIVATCGLLGVECSPLGMIKYI